MADYNARITDFVHGDDLPIVRNIETPESSIAKAWFTVKSVKSDPDSAALVQKIVTVEEETTAGVILPDQVEAGVTTVLFNLTPNNTLALLTAEGSPIWRHYDIKIKLLDGKVFTHEIGQIRGEKRVTISRH